MCAYSQLTQGTYRKIMLTANRTLLHSQCWAVSTDPSWKNNISSQSVCKHTHTNTPCMHMFVRPYPYFRVERGFVKGQLEQWALTVTSSPLSRQRLLSQQYLSLWEEKRPLGQHLKVHRRCLLIMGGWPVGGGGRGEVGVFEGVWLSIVSILSSLSNPFSVQDTSPLSPISCSALKSVTSSTGFLVPEGKDGEFTCGEFAKKLSCLCEEKSSLHSFSSPLSPEI